MVKGIWLIRRTECSVCHTQCTILSVLYCVPYSVCHSMCTQRFSVPFSQHCTLSAHCSEHCSIFSVIRCVCRGFSAHRFKHSPPLSVLTHCFNTILTPSIQCTTRRLHQRRRSYATKCGVQVDASEKSSTVTSPSLIPTTTNVIKVSLSPFFQEIMKK